MKTIVYAEPILDEKMFNKRLRKMNIEVWNIGTVRAGLMLRENKKGRIAVLNFANPFSPGAAQEGSLIDASNLLDSLERKDVIERFYNVNWRYQKSTWNNIYTDTIVYTRDVAFCLSDYVCNELVNWNMDVITCPAPSTKIEPANVEMAIIRHRAEGIIKSAILNKVDNLVLGAWGCGVFGQNPEVVSKAFMSVLENYPAFKNVVFAIPDSTSRNYKVFKKNCEEVK